MSLFYVFLFITSISFTLQAQPESVGDMYKLDTLARNWITPLTKSPIDKSTVARLQGLTEQDFQELMQDLERLLGIQRKTVSSYLPPMLTKIRIVDAVKNNLELLRSSSGDLDNVRTTAQELKRLIDGVLTQKQYELGPLRRGLADVPRFDSYEKLPSVSQSVGVRDIVKH